MDYITIPLSRETDILWKVKPPSSASTAESLYGSPDLNQACLGIVLVYDRLSYKDFTDISRFIHCDITITGRLAC